MTLTRLLAAALLLCSLPAFSQIQPVGTTSDSVYSGPIPTDRSLYFSPAATPSEPWRLISKTAVDVGGVNALDPAPVDHYHPDRHKDDSGRSFLSNARSRTHEPDLWLDGDGGITCLKLRSYVVARDSKNSDSTHLVSYSTCQPTSRYGLKTTEIRTESVYR
ncbi:MAG TPA: hypothetical protein VGM18_16390 [Candidatus Sulfotelmatobacter sp.]